MPNPPLSLSPLEYVTPSQQQARQENGAELAHVDENRLKCVLKCLLGLSEEEAHVLAYLLLHPQPTTAKDIAYSAKRNQEVVRRALRKLYAKGLINRRPFPLRRGGRAYIYEPKKELLEKLHGLCKAAYDVVEVIKSAKTG